MALTARAARAIDAGEYRYFSPVFRYDKSGTVLEVHMGALTNDPGIQGMQPVSLIAAATAAFVPSFLPPLTPEQELSVNPLLKALQAALGLPDSATEEAACAALTALGPLQRRAAVATAACTALQLGADATPEAVTAACASLRAAAPAPANSPAAPAAPDPTQFVPVQALAQVQGQLAALTAQVQGDRAQAAIAAARADGRLITPEQEAHARALAQTHGVAALTAFLGVLTPVPALAGTQTGGQAPASLARGDAPLTADELAICTAVGLSAAQYKAGAAPAAA